MSLTTVLNVEGMTCGNCERHVTTALLTIAGVTQVKADHTSATATIASASPLDLGAVASVLDEAGYSLK